jgi:hypothetical protein
MAKTKDQPIVVKQNEDNPEPMELIAASIIEISTAFKKMNASKLKPRTLFLLIRDMTNLPLTTIEKVLNAAQSLEKTYLK